jgi:anti-anti-sigma factor
MSAVLSDQFALSGVELGLDQAEQIKAQGVAMIGTSDGPITVDLAGLERANSITIAVLVAWYRHATLQNKNIMFVNLSQDLHNIIEFSGLLSVLCKTK